MSVNKFKVGDIVKCVNVSDINNLTFGKEYRVIQNHTGGLLYLCDDNGDEACYYSCRFELSDSGDSVKTQHKPPKLKEGDMVYLIGFDCLKPRKLQVGFNNGLPMKFKVEVANDVFETFTEDGKYLTIDTTPSIVLATEENRQMLNKLLGVEYEPVKLTGSDLAKKLLKDKPQTCYVSDKSDEYASSNKCIDLIAKFECGRFITMSGVHWEHAVPCNQHGYVLMDE